MHSAKISVGPINRNNPQIVDEFISLLAAYYHNGQIYDGNWPLYKQGNSLEVVVSVPDKNSLAAKYSNKYVKSRTSKLNELGMTLSKSSLGFEPGSMKVCRCENRSSLILYTTYISAESCLRCGDCFAPVPLYTLPHLYDYGYYNVLCWETDYKSCDRLQMHCTTGERFGEKQLLDPLSTLSTQGRAICSEIGKATGIKTYYYLMKSRGRSRNQETKRRCPICDKKWLLKQRLHDLFDFKCEKCLLLSNIAWDS